MKQAGFSFIELLVALLISSMLAVVLYQVFVQTNQTVRRLRIELDAYADYVSSYAQLEQDIMSICVPRSAAQPGSDKKDEKSKRKKELVISELKEGKIAAFSFVTTHAFSVVDEQINRLVWVTYRLVPQPDSKQLLLVREELPYAYYVSDDEKQGKSATRAYPLLSSVAAATVTFWVPEAAEKKAEPKMEKQQKLTKLEAWGTEAQQRKSKQRIPAYVELQTTLVARDGTELPLICDTIVPAGFCIMPEKAPEQPKPQQPQTPGTPAQQPPAQAQTTATQQQGERYAPKP